VSSFRIDVVLNDGSICDSYRRVGQLADTCIFAFALSDELSVPNRPQYAAVRWVRVYEGMTLAISIQITPGEPLAGAGDRRSGSIS
jgi:hypothetical protein